MWKHQCMLVQLVLQKILLLFAIVWLKSRPPQLVVFPNNCTSHARRWWTLCIRLAFTHLQGAIDSRTKAKRRQWSEWWEEMATVDDLFSKKIIFSDEAHFHLSGFVNKQNCHIWTNDNPRVVVEKPMHPQRVTVWCGLCAVRQLLWMVFAIVRR